LCDDEYQIQVALFELYWWRLQVYKQYFSNWRIHSSFDHHKDNRSW